MRILIISLLLLSGTVNAQQYDPYNPYYQMQQETVRMQRQQPQMVQPQQSYEQQQTEMRMLQELNQRAIIEPTKHYRQK